MGIPLQRSRNVLKHYRENGYNAVKALVKAGYAESTAQHGSGKVINLAIKNVMKHDMQKIVESSNPMESIFGYVGLTENDVALEFLKIIKQDKDLTNKLKALMPFLSQKGIKWNEEKTLNAPALNITVKSNIPVDEQLTTDNEVATTDVVPIVDNDNLVDNTAL